MKILFLFITIHLFIACSPQNDATSKYETENYVPLEKKNFKTQYYLPQDALRISIDPKSSRDWKANEENSIVINLINNIRGLKNAELKARVGQQEGLPQWMSFKFVESKGNSKTYILKASPALRSANDVSVSLYELVFYVAYDKVLSDPSSVEMLNFYKSQSSQQVNIEIDKL